MEFSKTANHATVAAGIRNRNAHSGDFGVETCKNAGFFAGSTSWRLQRIAEGEDVYRRASVEAELPSCSLGRRRSDVLFSWGYEILCQWRVRRVAHLSRSELLSVQRGRIRNRPGGAVLCAVVRCADVLCTIVPGRMIRGVLNFAGRDHRR